MKKPLLIIGAVLGSATVASGAKVPTSSHEMMGANPFGPMGTAATTHVARQGSSVIIDISGVESRDAFGSPNNQVLLIDMAAALGKPAGSQIDMNGIGWDTNQTALGTSWLSEMRIYFDDNIAPDGIGLHLRPGTGNAPGSGTFSSNGVFKFADITPTPIPNVVLPNGILRLEFYESYDDAAGVVDGVYNTLSTLTVQTTNTAPAPGALALLGMAGLVGSRRRRS